ncbi:MAG TPA: hypothetical protein VHT91_45570 [Kofleriaceae bacterium]|nr:hypothetical protein [Kofleriaceae bacterium]
MTFMMDPAPRSVMNRTTSESFLPVRGVVHDGSITVYASWV